MIGVDIYPNTVLQNLNERDFEDISEKDVQGSFHFGDEAMGGSEDLKIS